MDPTNNLSFEFDLDLKQLSNAIQFLNRTVQSGDPCYDPIKQQLAEIIQKFKDVEFEFTITGSDEVNEYLNAAVNSSAKNLQNQQEQGIVAEDKTEAEKVQHTAMEKHSRKSVYVRARFGNKSKLSSKLLGPKKCTTLYINQTKFVLSLLQSYPERDKPFLIPTLTIWTLADSKAKVHFDLKIQNTPQKCQDKRNIFKVQSILCSDQQKQLQNLGQTFD